MKASELKAGQTIRFEFGSEDNWITLGIAEIHHFQNMVLVTGNSICNFQREFAFNPDEDVEVVDMIGGGENG